MRLFTVDAFTNKPFSGNPAGVCILDHSISDKLCQLIAREINYSETAFVLAGNNRYRIRWFTPVTEVVLCGHATLAAARVLYEYSYCSDETIIEFESLSGVLTAKKKGDKIELNFPQLFVDDAEAHGVIEKVFDISPVYTGKDDKRYLIEIADPEKLMSLKPDFQLLRSVVPGRFIITAKSNFPEYDFISRYFAPEVGVPEDPVTGTAHCYLAPYWSKKLGKTRMVGFQASERSGIIECEIGGQNRLYLRADAVIMNEIMPKWDLSQLEIAYPL